jgi:hypothetical protein
VKLIPIYRRGTEHLFCMDFPMSTVQRGGICLPTGMLKFGQNMNLMSASEHEDLMATGLQHPTDQIDPTISLAGLYFKYVKTGSPTRYYYHELDGEPRKHFHYDPMGNYRIIEVNFASEFPIVESAGIIGKVAMQVGGFVNIQTGDHYLDGKISVNPEFADSIEIVGYDLDIYRTNTNNPA